MSDVEMKLIAELNAIKEKHLAGHVGEAEQGYQRLLERAPNFVAVLHPYGIALQQLGRHADAVQAIQKWLAVSPTDADALINLANSLTILGRIAEAVEACRQAVAARPGSQPARAALAQAEALLAQSGHATQAVAAPAPPPVSLETKFAQANRAAGEGRTEDAIAIYQDMLSINPNLPEVLVNLGNQLYAAGRAGESIGHYEKALKLRPGMREALLNMGNAVHELGDNKRALRCFEQALAADPTYRDALNNLANIHLAVGNGDKALHYTRRLLKLYPQHMQAHGTAAGVLLARGDLKEGWEHYEWRWLKPELPVPLRDFGCPEWTGEDISDKTILLSHEQGLGDSIQFIRFVPDVVKRARHVVLEAPANLHALYSHIPDVTLVTHNGPLPAFDVHLPFMSLPYVLGITLENLPTPIPYLQAEPARVEAWRHRLPQDGFRIGIVWQGKAGTSVDKGRSYALQHLAPVARIPGVTLISLQKGYGLDQLDNLPDGMKVVTLGPDFDEGEGAFLDTAAVMAHMDLIISSDTSVAHLAGALGCNVWVPLKLSPDWRWMLEREDCPWYPTMRLFRQHEIGDWPKVFDRIAAEVVALKDGDRSRLLPPPPPPARPVQDYPPVPRPPLPAVRPPANVTARSVSVPVAEGICEAPTRYGRMRYPSGDSVVGRCLDLYGEWAEAEVQFCMTLLRDGDVVVEAGAGIGAHTLALARAVGTDGRVHAVEPDPAANQLLTWNVSANDLPQVSTATVVSVDSLNLDKLRLLKAERPEMAADILAGARATIDRCRPILYLDGGEQGRCDELISVVRTLGYQLWWHHPVLFNPNNFRSNTINQISTPRSCRLLCVPSERDAIVVGLEAVK